MKKPILLIGGGGHCKSCIDVVESENKYDIVGIVDTIDKIGDKVLGYPIIACDEDLPELITKDMNVLISVGQIKSAALRIKLFNKVKELNALFPTIISPSSYISKHAEIGEGSIVMHGAIINAEAKIGVNNIINSKVLVEHEVVIGNHCHISTGSNINGQVVIDDECFVGSGVTLANNISVKNKVIIPAGATVFKDITKSGIYIKH